MLLFVVSFFAGYFDFLIPLSNILGFAKEYNKVLIGSKSELVLVRSNTSTRAFLENPPSAAAIAAAGGDVNNVPHETHKLTLTRISWLLPYVTLSNPLKVRLLHSLGKGSNIPIAFRSWDLNTYPLLPTTTKHVWTVKTTTQLEKPRFVIIGFQTTVQNPSRFSIFSLRDVKVHLNSQRFPYMQLSCRTDLFEFAHLYELYSKFQESYYGTRSEPLLNLDEWLEYAPLIVIDCNHQDETVKSGPVDVRIEFETVDNIPGNISAYALIIHDRIVEYNPLTGLVVKRN